MELVLLLLMMDPYIQEVSIMVLLMDKEDIYIKIIRIIRAILNKMKPVG
jgi:hypothetical protein